MGVGIPYAMGIKLAARSRCSASPARLGADVHPGAVHLKQYNTPIKIVSLNNRYLGMVRQWQELRVRGRYSHSYMDAAQLRQVGRGLWPRRHADRAAAGRGCRRRGARRAMKRPHGVHGLPDRPDGKRLSDGPARHDHRRCRSAGRPSKMYFAAASRRAMIQSCKTNRRSPRTARGILVESMKHIHPDWKTRPARCPAWWACFRPGLQHRVADRRAHGGMSPVAA